MLVPPPNCGLLGGCPRMGVLLLTHALMLLVPPPNCGLSVGVLVWASSPNCGLSVGVLVWASCGAHRWVSPYGGIPVWGNVRYFINFLETDALNTWD